MWERVHHTSECQPRMHYTKTYSKKMTGFEEKEEWSGQLGKTIKCVRGREN